MKRILTSTKFNGQQLITQTSSSVSFQVGINNTSDDRIAVTFGGVHLSALVSTATSISGAATGAQSALDTIDNALKTVSTTRGRFGAVMNRLEITSANIQTASLNLAAANSRIRDVDVAAETANLSRTQVLAQAGTSILAQANQSPRWLSPLLR